ENAGDRQQRHAQHHGGGINGGGAEHHHKQRKYNVHRNADDKGRNGQCQARPHALGNIRSDHAPFVRAAKIEHKQTHGFFKKDGVGENALTALGGIQKQRFVVTALRFPLLNGFFGNVLVTQLHPRHLVGGIHHKKQREGSQVHPDQNRNGVQQAADNISKHGKSSVARGRNTLLLTATPGQYTGHHNNQYHHQHQTQRPQYRLVPLLLFL